MQKIFSGFVISGVFLLLFFSAANCFAQRKSVDKIWYKQPAQNWESEALPIGNGRMGAMLFGGIKEDHIQFNEQSLWSGDNNWDGAYETGDHGFGAYRNFGDITIEFDRSSNAENYYRALSIFSGVHTTSFQINNVHYQTEAFASYPDQVMVFKYSCGKNGSLSGSITMQSAQGANTIGNNSNLSFEGVMPNQLKYVAKLIAVNTGGTVKAIQNKLVFKKCSSLILYLSCRTNYKPDFNSNWRGAEPMPSIEHDLSNAIQKGYNNVLKGHISDIEKLTLAATIDIGCSDDSIISLPTDVRLKKYAAGGEDPDLEEMMFQYGRYLLISSSRPGGLPANLQGLWNNSNTPPWASDYHNNINIQMNYWAAESTNLSQCHLPLIDFIVAAQEPCRIATRKAFGENIRGWTARTSQSIFGGNGWEWNITASAWYAQHVFEHWAFTNDKTYLKNTAYPILKEVCEFWEDRLKKMPDGTFKAPNGWSPEHGQREDGVMYDQELVWDLFQNYLEAAQALNIDTAYQSKISFLQKHLAPNKIGKWGQLQEWQEDRDDPDDQHRHTSHLFAVYPGRQINPAQTPELAKAAIISLRSRSGNYGKNINTAFTVESTVGDSRRSWTWPWRCALWARLYDGEKAGIMIRGLLTYNTLSNLFTNHPPFQIDGNLGISGAIAEMLLQSHTGVIQLLPALPEAWKEKGSFHGLKAKGGYTVDCEWQGGEVIRYKIVSVKSSKVKVNINGETKVITSQQN